METEKDSSHVESNNKADDQPSSSDQSNSNSTAIASTNTAVTPASQQQQQQQQQPQSNTPTVNNANTTTSEAQPQPETTSAITKQDQQPTPTSTSTTASPSSPPLGPQTTSSPPTLASSPPSSTQNTPRDRKISTILGGIARGLGLNKDNKQPSTAAPASATTDSSSATPPADQKNPVNRVVSPRDSLNAGGPQTTKDNIPKSSTTSTTNTSATATTSPTLAPTPAPTTAVTTTAKGTTTTTTTTTTAAAEPATITLAAHQPEISSNNNNNSTNTKTATESEAGKLAPASAEGAPTSQLQQQPEPPLNVSPTVNTTTGHGGDANNNNNNSAEAGNDKQHDIMATTPPQLQSPPLQSAPSSPASEMGSYNMSQESNINRDNANGGTTTTTTTTNVSGDALATTSLPPELQNINNLEFNSTVTRDDYVRQLFDLPKDEKVLEDLICAYYKRVTLHGKMFITPNFICFISAILGFKTLLKIKFSDIVDIRKRHSALFVPNAIEIFTNNKQAHFFSGFLIRDQTAAILQQLWKISLQKRYDAYLDGHTLDVLDLSSVAATTYDEGLAAISTSTTSSTSTSDLSTCSAPIPIKKPGDNDLPHAGSLSETPSQKSPGGSWAPSSLPATLSGLESSIAHNGGSPAKSQGGDTTSAEERNAIDASTKPNNNDNNYDDAVEEEDEAEEEAKEQMHRRSLADDLSLMDIFKIPNVEMKHITSQEFPLQLDKFFDLILSDESSFLRDYHLHRGDVDVEIDKYDGLEPGVPHIRSVRYKTTVANSKFFRGSKQSHIYETQRLLILKSNNRTQSHIIRHSSILSTDLPYSDTFQVEVKTYFSEMHRPLSTRNSRRNRQLLFDANNNNNTSNISGNTIITCNVDVYVGVNFIRGSAGRPSKKIEVTVMQEAASAIAQWTGMVRDFINNYLNNQQSDKQKPQHADTLKQLQRQLSQQIPVLNANLDHQPPPPNPTSSTTRTAEDGNNNNTTADNDNNNNNSSSSSSDITTNNNNNNNNNSSAPGRGNQAGAQSREASTTIPSASSGDNGSSSSSTTTTTTNNNNNNNYAETSSSAPPTTTAAGSPEVTTAPSSSSPSSSSSSKPKKHVSLPSSLPTCASKASSPSRPAALATVSSTAASKAAAAATTITAPTTTTTTATPTTTATAAATATSASVSAIKQKQEPKQSILETVGSLLASAGELLGAAKEMAGYIPKNAIVFAGLLFMVAFCMLAQFYTLSRIATVEKEIMVRIHQIDEYDYLARATQQDYARKISEAATIIREPSATEENATGTTAAEAATTTTTTTTTSSDDGSSSVDADYQSRRLKHAFELTKHFANKLIHDRDYLEGSAATTATAVTGQEEQQQQQQQQEEEEHKEGASEDGTTEADLLAILREEIMDIRLQLLEAQGRQQRQHRHHTEHAVSDSNSRGGVGGVEAATHLSNTLLLEILSSMNTNFVLFLVSGIVFVLYQINNNNNNNSRRTTAS